MPAPQDKKEGSVNQLDFKAFFPVKTCIESEEVIQHVDGVIDHADFYAHVCLFTRGRKIRPVRPQTRE